MERQNFSQYHIKASTSVPFKIFRTREPKNASPPPAPQDPQGPIINGDEDEFEIGWDLGPGTWDPLQQCWKAYTWTNTSLSNKIQGNYRRLKITAYMHGWGKLWIIRYKKIKKKNKTKKQNNPTAFKDLLLKILEQNQGTTPLPFSQRRQRCWQTWRTT